MIRARGDEVKRRRESWVPNRRRCRRRRRTPNTGKAKKLDDADEDEKMPDGVCAGTGSGSRKSAVDLACGSA